MNTISEQLAEKLRDPEYRKAFVASQINIGIPFQIRAMLKNRPGWTQETLAERAHMLQPRISALMTPGKTRPNIETLRRIAEAFDCGLAVRFAPFSELARWSEDFDPESFAVPDFDHDTGFVEHYEITTTLQEHAALSILQWPVQWLATDRDTFLWGERVAGEIGLRELANAVPTAQTEIPRATLVHLHQVSRKGPHIAVEVQHYLAAADGGNAIHTASTC